MSKVFEKIPQEVKEELNDWYDYIPIDFKEDGEFYKEIEEYFFTENIKDISDIRDNMSIYKNFDEFCIIEVDECLLIDIPEGEIKEIVKNYFNYEQFYEHFYKMNRDIHELSNGVILEIY